MINDLLPRYYEAHDAADHEGRYEIVRSIMIDGHEVAWTRYSSVIADDMTGLGREGRPVESFGLNCECYFTEGVGWEIHDKFGIVSLDGSHGCRKLRAAVYLRLEELKEEYLEKFGAYDTFNLYDHFGDVIADLIERDKRGEFIGETGNAAHTWGGHFYASVPMHIFDNRLEYILGKLRELEAAKAVSLNGYVVCEYRTPPEPSWSENFTYEQDGYVVKASLPDHAKMDQQYRLELFNFEGKSVTTEFVDLVHEPVFGPDAEDIDAAKRRSIEMIEAAAASAA